MTGQWYGTCAVEDLRARVLTFAVKVTAGDDVPGAAGTPESGLDIECGLLVKALDISAAPHLPAKPAVEA